MREIRRLVIHHSLTADSGSVSWGAIWRYHTAPKPEGKAWRDIGYHAGVELVGDRYMLIGGRPARQTGSHARGANRDSLGLCFVGDFTTTPPAREQLEAAVPWLALACHGFGLDPETAIVGHRDVSRGRTCPGDAFPLEGLRRLVTRELRRY